MDTPPEPSQESVSDITSDIKGGEDLHHTLLSDDAVLEPFVATETAPLRVKGRLADKLAAIIAATALGLSILLSGLFFAGFVANDYHLFAITSALALSLFLGGFAIVPMAIITILARRAYQKGGRVSLYLWSLFLILPWLALSILCLIYTPLPMWMSAIAVLFAVLLSLWGIISLIFDFKETRHKNLKLL